MGRMILISENELKGIVKETVANALDSITKKITARSARVNYRNMLFRPTVSETLQRIKESQYSCGSSGGGCGSTYEDDDYGYGGCGSSLSRSYGGYGDCGSGGGGCGT